MRTSSKFGAAAAAFAAIVTVTGAFAQESEAPQTGGMMQGHDSMSGEMKGGDMSKMKGMMEKMAPMMEQCSEMMAAMSEKMKSDSSAQDDNG